LATYTATESFDDQTVLGTWLSAGVSISTNSFRRLCELLKWMNEREVENIINDAGFSIDAGDYLSKINTESDIESSDAVNNICLSNQRLTPGIKFSLPGRPYLEELFNENIVEIVMNEERYKKMGILFPSAIVLYGPPGCGKTYAVDRLVKFLDWPSFSIDSSSIGSPYIHDTSKKIADVFNKAIENAPSVVVIDEMEAFLTNRYIGQSFGLHHVEEVAEFLHRIPEAAKNRVLVIAMTNMIDSIDPAILRKGRFDHIMEVKMPSTEEIHLLISNMLAKLPVAEDVNIHVASEKLEGRPISDVAFVVKEAGRIAVKKDKEVIDNNDLLEAIELLPQQSDNGPRKIGLR
jgi:ATP-dependent 26S proteasome regulatory subunit